MFPGPSRRRLEQEAWVARRYKMWWSNIPATYTHNIRTFTLVRKHQFTWCMYIFFSFSSFLFPSIYITALALACIPHIFLITGCLRLQPSLQHGPNSGPAQHITGPRSLPLVLKTSPDVIQILGTRPWHQKACWFCKDIKSLIDRMGDAIEGR